MVAHVDWQSLPPALSPALTDCLSEPGSLTARLIATGHRFAVQVVQQGDVSAYADEAAELNCPVGTRLHGRHVLLTLDDTPVIFARSVSRIDCPEWSPVLARGSRSLGLTLFGEMPAALQRDALQYLALPAGHPLLQAAHAAFSANPAASGWPARRCRFLMNNAPLLVCEVFLPTLEAFLA